MDQFFSDLWLDFSMEKVVSIFVLIKETAWETPFHCRYSRAQEVSLLLNIFCKSQFVLK